jgi:hypothetical protein
MPASSTFLVAYMIYYTECVKIVLGQMCENKYGTYIILGHILHQGEIFLGHTRTKFPFVTFALPKMTTN